MAYQTTPTYHNKYTYWSPRLLAIIGILFVSILSFDVFGEYSGWNLVIAFLTHNIPTFIMILGLIISWKNDLYGALIFNIIALVSVTFFYLLGDYLGLLFVTLPCFIVGMLFYYNGYREEL